ADNRTYEQEQDQGGDVIYRGDVKRAKLSGEEVVCGERAQKGGQQTRPKAAEVRGDDDGWEKRHVRNRVPEHRPERPPNQEAKGRRRYRHAVSNKRGTRSFV